MLVSKLLKISSKAQVISNSKLHSRSHSHLPLTGLFAVNKPCNVTSTTIIDLLQHVCKRNQDHPLVRGVLELDMSKRAKRGLVKVGHGGTLDPLARGIVVVGMGAGCKKLHNMSGASKTYIAEGRLGFSSTTLDSTGSLVSEAPTDHVTKESLLTVLESLKGEITQTPPLYSALSMDGKRLYEYAREGLALPRDIPSRKVQIYELELLSFSNDGMISGSVLESYGFCNKNNGEIDDGSSRVEYSTSFMPKQLKDNLGDPNHIPISSVLPGLVFHIRVHCSSGTYIRTLIADIAKRLDTVGLMSDLLRVDQSGFKLGGEATLEMIDCENIDKVDQAIQAGNRIYQSNGVKYE